jgi:hypothetical protein
MAARKKAKASTTLVPVEPRESTGERISLGEFLSEKAPSQEFHFWIVGDSPLICHSWSEKAKLEMLRKQTGATRAAKEKRDPETDFVNSLYDMGNNTYGFPITGIKKAVWSCAHKDRGIARTDVQAALWLDAEIIRVQTAHPGARCDLPLVRIFGDKPEMREDMVRLGSGVTKKASLAYRAQFSTWAVRVTGTVNPQQVAPHQLAFLVRQAGLSIGLGDWRNERGGWFGSFHIATPAEQKEWEAFAAGKGPLPKVKPKSPPPIMEAAE